MEVLSNGMKVKFWIPVEEEPDIDRFVDEQIMVDMDLFMLVGILRQVTTCKKKNEEKEFEYFKQLTVEVINICSAADNNINISIPSGKEEFIYEVKFRYAPEPEVEEEPELTNENDLELAYKDSEGRDIDRETEKPVKGRDIDAEADMDMTPGTIYDGAAPIEQVAALVDDLDENQDNLVIKDERTGEDVDVTEMIDDIAAKIEPEDDFSFADEPAANAIVEEEKGDDDETRTVSGDDYKRTEPVTELDDDGIDWGE